MDMSSKTTNTVDTVSFGLNRPLSSSTIAGLVLVPLGLWAALVPFLLGGWSSDWSLGRIMLTVAPGAVALTGGLIMLSGHRRAFTFGGGLALAAGLWFLAAPLLYAMTVGTELGTLSGGESVRMLQWMPFFFGAGALVSLFSAYGLGLLTPMQFADEAWSEQVAPSTQSTRKRVPLPPERQRRQRGEKERAGQTARPHARAKGSGKRSA